MGKQHKTLTSDDISFINKQKMFYIASCSNAEVNLSPKGYDCIKVLNKNEILFMSYPGSANRTYRDSQNDGEFTLVFNDFESHNGKILRIFCKADAICKELDEFTTYSKLFGINEKVIRNFFVFKIYAIEISCGDSVPIMEFKKERKFIKNWAKSMNEKDKLEEYKEKHFIPVDLHNI